MPYFQGLARGYRRQARWWVVNLLVHVALGATTPMRWFVPAFIGLAFLAGVMFTRARQRSFDAAERAWQIETSQTMTAMVTSGLYDSPAETLEALRDGPLPPGWRRADWVRAHDAVAADMRRLFDQREPN